ncbi:MAG TPA: hypothetical protein VFU47_09905, partial [Armatimonadota bacterium]|nr:hypothetical protein [Armatimonadota bacterium]
VQKVTHEYPAPPTGLPPYLQGALMRAMAKNPVHRYAKASEMAEDLRAGRVPAVTWTAAAPAAPPVLVSPVAVPERVFLGGEGPVAPPVTGGFGWPGPPPPAPAAEPPRTPCAAHPAKNAVGNCSRCSRAVCYGCMVEIPGQGTLCRSCAFGR